MRLVLLVETTTKGVWVGGRTIIKDNERRLVTGWTITEEQRKASGWGGTIHGLAASPWMGHH